MRTFLFVVLLGCCMSSAAIASDKIFPAAELQEFQGQYDLADGRLLVVTQRGHRLFVQLDNQPAVEVTPAGAAAFADKSGALRVEFDQYPNGNVVGVRLTDTAGAGRLVSRRD